MYMFNSKNSAYSSADVDYAPAFPFAFTALLSLIITAFYAVIFFVVQLLNLIKLSAIIKREFVKSKFRILGYTN